MPKIYLVRHGKAAAGWDAHPDPGLDDIGKKQAEETAETLAPLGPLDIVSSPLARARETARPLAEKWRKTPRIEPGVAEIPSPTDDLGERSRWLHNVMIDNWSCQDPFLTNWRQAAIDAVAALENDTVIFSHFIAINVIVGAAVGDDRVVNFLPDNGSITTVEIKAGQISLIERGREAGTQVN